MKKILKTLALIAITVAAVKGIERVNSKLLNPSEKEKVSTIRNDITDFILFED